MLLLNVYLVQIYGWIEGGWGCMFVQICFWLGWRCWNFEVPCVLYYLKVKCNVMFNVGNVEVQSLSVYYKVYVKIEGVMFFFVVEGSCM